MRGAIKGDEGPQRQSASGRDVDLEIGSREVDLEIGSRKVDLEMWISSGGSQFEQHHQASSRELTTAKLGRLLSSDPSASLSEIRAGKGTFSALVTDARASGRNQPTLASLPVCGRGGRDGEVVHREFTAGTQSHL